MRSPRVRCAHRAALLALALLGAASAATASETRIRTLGGDGDWFEDTGNVLRWPGSLPAYANLALLEYGVYGPHASDRAGLGVNWRPSPGPRGTCLGLHLYGDEDRLRDPERPDAVNLLAGRRVGRLAVGLRLGVTQLQWANPEGDRRQVEAALALGGRLETSARSYQEAALELRGSWLRHAWEGSVVEDEGWRNFTLRARSFHEVAGAVVLVPIVDYVRDDRGVLALPYAPVARWIDSWRFKCGLGLNVFPREDAMVLVAADWRQGRYADRDVTDATIAFQDYDFSYGTVRVGVEARVRPWLTVRASGVRSPFGVAREPAGAAAEDFDVAFGLGLHLGDLDADLLLDDDAPFNFGSVLTNAGGEEASTFTSASLTYSF